MLQKSKLVNLFFEQIDTEYRKRALVSYRAIVDFLWQKNAFTYFTETHELDLEKYIPMPDHTNLVLIFKPVLGGNGAKFSYREDGKFTITIFVSFPSKDVFNMDFDKKVKDWFVTSRSSYIHEFVHYLDIKDIKDLMSIKTPNPDKEEEYFNHPNEVRAYLQQGLSDIENTIEEKIFNKRKMFERIFGENAVQFANNALKKYFNQNFVRYLSPENEEFVRIELKKFYKQIFPTLKENSMKITTKQLYKLIEESIQNRLSGMMLENDLDNSFKKDLEKELSQHDWFYEYSDDHSVWTRGNRHDRFIRDLIKAGLQTGELTKKDVEELWNKYAPMEFKINIPI